ncbi:hypothetical protein Fot_03558 [Forsythia ovata]|uniref:Uncharacterized protein n=1 Tax=Forsythia ovata TaxID=205694 RepID=A0ABD1XA38_9LAMI
MERGFTHQGGLTHSGPTESHEGGPTPSSPTESHEEGPTYNRSYPTSMEMEFPHQRSPTSSENVGKTLWVEEVTHSIQRMIDYLKELKLSAVKDEDRKICLKSTIGVRGGIGRGRKGIFTWRAELASSIKASLGERTLATTAGIEGASKASSLFHLKKEVKAETGVFIIDQDEEFYTTLMFYTFEDLPPLVRVLET